MSGSRLSCYNLVRAVVLITLISATRGKILPEKTFNQEQTNRQISDNNEKAIVPEQDGLLGDNANRMGTDSNYDVDNKQSTIKRNEGDDDIINEENEEEFEGKQNEKWVLLTGRYNKKHRITNFDGVVIDESNIMGSLSLENYWKTEILNAVSGEQVKPRNIRPTLKQGNNEITILTDEATTARSHTQPTYLINTTCPATENYTCSFYVPVEKIVPCWWNRNYRCREMRRESVTTICKRTIRVCCPGFYLHSNGYCRSIVTVPVTPSPSKVCGGTMTSREGTITSPNYPQNYPNEQNCTWKLYAPKGYKVVLKVIDIGLEDPVGACELHNWNCFKLCEFDKLKIRDVTKGNIVKTVCGYLAPTTEFVSTGNRVEIDFISDLSSGGKGFKIAYSFTTEYELSSYHFCPGGMTWQTCRRKCARTCGRPGNGTYVKCVNGNQLSSVVLSSRQDDFTCVPGCSCPSHAPIWSQGVCIKPEFCPDKFFQCGKPAVESKAKIVGGQVADKYAWPWMVQIESDSIFHICGATLICSNWVVTAAHCFLNMDKTALDLNPRRYLVNIGKYWKNEQLDDRKVQTYEPAKIIRHPSYNIENDKNDIALIRLSHAVDVTDYVRPACLPETTLPGVTYESSKYADYQQPTVGTIGVVLGWGTTRNIGPNSQQLKEANIEIRPGRFCVYDSYVWKLMICAGGHKNKDTCRGDSGGPLLCKRSEKWYLDGITSYGDACGDENIAGGYTRISSYVGWIKSYIGKVCEL